MPNYSFDDDTKEEPEIKIEDLPVFPADEEEEELPKIPDNLE